MKTKTIALTLAASAVAMLVAACGGGGGGDTPPAPAPDPSLQVSGTAATGAALADASVEVKCATGTGTATTGTAGTYTVTITGGALPCMVEVKKTVAGTTITLHSVVEAGTLNATDRRTVAHANVTPVTEMIVAQLGAALPEDSFKGFKGDAITQAQIDAAKAAIVAALKNAGVDVSGIDPLKAELVAATSSGKGNAYDQLLDALAAKVDLESLKVVVNQIATAALVKSEDGLKNAMEAVSGGSLAGCPVAVSGKYRAVDVLGHARLLTVDFKNMKVTADGTTDSLTITADADNACVFTGSGTLDATPSAFKAVIGANGLGNFRAHATNSTDPVLSAGLDGYFFPVQSHSYSAVRGTWSVLESDINAMEHNASQVTFGEERKITSCTYDAAWNCVADTGSLTAVERSDGGVEVPISSTEKVVLYGYRAPNGAFALFGGTQPVSNVAILPRAMVAAKLAALPALTVGTQVKSWDTSYNASATSTNISVAGSDPAPLSYTIMSADATAGTAVRRNDATGRQETLRLNKPIAGVRTRDAGTFNGAPFASLYQVPLTGLGVTVSINAVPFSRTTPGSTFLYNIAVVRP